MRMLGVTCLYIMIFLFLLIVSQLSEQQDFLPVASFEDPLLAEIKEKRKAYEREAENAYIDRVWKKTAGRAGRQVLIEKSYQRMKEKGVFDESLLEYKYIKPKISLKDLPASPIYRGHPEKKMVAFLINVSWGTEHIPGILKILKENDIQASFFIEGQWAQENKNYLQMIVEQKHVIGNHAYNHPNMANLNENEIKEQIEKTNEILEAIIKEQPRWFAPPSGSFNEKVVQMADEAKMETILWTVDTIDWKNPSVSVMINRVINNIHPGATILMHPTLAVVNGLETLIEEIETEGYKIDTIEQLLDESW